MAMIQFLRGTQAGLAAKETINGALYFTTDTHKIYMGTETGKQEFSAIGVVCAVSALPSVAAAIKGKFYYAEAENVFCFPYNGEWKQVNPDTGATSIEVVDGGGNAISAASYDASTRKITLTKGETFATPSVVDGKISDKVGAIDGTVKDYVDEKTSGIASESALTALGNRVTTAEGKITALENANKEGGAVANAIADAKKAGTDAQTTANQAKADAAAAQTDVDALEEKVGTVPADKTVVGMIGEVETAYKAKDNELAASIKAISDDYLKSTDKTELQGNIDKKVDKTAYDAKVTALEAADTTLQGNIDAEKTARETADNAQVTRIADLETKITGLSGAMHFEGVKAEVPADVSGYEAGDVIIVGEKEYVFNGTAFVEFGDVSAEGERIAALETTVGKAAEGEKPATGLIKDIADNASAIAAEKTRAEGAEAANKALAEAAQAAAKTAQDGVDAIKADYLKTADKTELQGNIDGVSNRVKAIEDKNISNGANKVEASTTNGNIKIDGTETVVYTHPAEHAISEVTGLQSALDAKAAQTSLDTTNASVAANASAITALQTGKADKATTLAGYGITDAYTQAQVNNLLTWGTF